ncbi:MAG: L,D-transpeptidase [Chloroflexota bacterium]|nr:L,D-transpeptidase [Chloroflexota bacterium]
MSPNWQQAQSALQQAKQALQREDRRSARHWAERAVSLAPDREEPWLFLAAIASPRASLAYLQQALDLNPKSEFARRGMHWAIQRWRDQPPAPPLARKTMAVDISPTVLTRSQPTVWPWILILLIVATGFFFWARPPALALTLPNAVPVSLAQIAASKATSTFTATASATPTFTLTASPTFTTTLTPTATATPTPTSTATATPTFIPSNTPRPQPTNTPKPTKIPTDASNVSLPPNVDDNTRWINIDLSDQRLYAYKGEKLLKSYIVSTGTWQHPTVTGQYHIYAKYRYSTMAGPGYYLPDVPYAMYFYKGYSMHGTYWHNNFGNPMSHGCVNMVTSDAGWVYNWASVGTLVNVRP